MHTGKTVGSTAITYAAPEDRLAKRATIRLVERLSGQAHLERLYQEARRERRQGESIWTLGLRKLDLELRYDPARLREVPGAGQPLVVVANHPFGVVDGLSICHLVSLVRPDLKVMAMSTLGQVPEVRDQLLPIDFAGTREAVSTSARSRAAARAHLARGGCLVIFPAGQVSTAPRPFGRAEDAPWHPFIGRLILAVGAAVLPVYFAGQNSRVFQLASHLGALSPTLRLALLMGEAVRRIGREVEARLGDAIPFAALSHLDDPRALTLHLRAVTLALGQASAAAEAAGPPAGGAVQSFLAAHRKAAQHVLERRTRTY